MRQILLLAAIVAVAPLHALPTASQIATAFKALDATANAGISLEEWEHGSFALFRAADRNANDSIDADELSGSTIAQDTFLRADANRDGKLGVGEFMALRRALFQLADIDRTDSLSPTEFDLLILMEQVGWQDRNRNDRIELSELRESLQKAFAQLDTDRDGALTAAEASFMASATFTRFDRDASGRLSLDEFAGGYRADLLSES